MATTPHRVLNAIGTALFAGALARLNHGAEVERATDAMITEAGRQIALQFESADARDIKTIGMMTVSLAAAAFLAAAHHDWASVYGAPLQAPPLLVLVLSLASFVMSLWTHRFMRGTDVSDLYRRTGSSLTMIQLKGYILSELVKAIEHNDTLSPGKSGWYTAGCWMLAAAAVLAVVALVA